jgi:hypothetical protein
MRNGLPLAYGTYRVLWTIAHLALVAAGVLLAVLWFLHDGEGMRAASALWSALSDAQQKVASAIPFPWGH